jgi:uncharacterized protein (TIGR02001 family)
VRRTILNHRDALFALLFLIEYYHNIMIFMRIKFWHKCCFVFSAHFLSLVFYICFYSKGNSMKKKLISLAVMGVFATLSGIALAEDAAPAPAAAAAAPASPWTVTTNINLVSDYYFRGISQTFHKPAVQGGLDISHSSGFYVGTWFSNVSEDTFANGGLEIDYYGGYNGTFGDTIKDLGWTVGGYGYYYPGAKYPGISEDFNTFEVNAGLSYKWVSAKISYDLTDWYGANSSTGFDGNTKGSYYAELNAAIPLPIWDLTLIGHVARENVDGELTAANAALLNGKADPSYTDYKIGLSKAFKIAASDGWSAGVYYIGATNGGNSGYWGKGGWGGASFNGHSSKDLADGHLVITVGRTF